MYDFAEREKMEQKKYLKWYNKLGYGVGDVAGNVVYVLLSSFVMLYLTNTVGLRAGLCGTLIAVSNLINCIPDVFFGAWIDKTRTRMGRARPWMLFSYIGCAVTLVAVFAIPESLGDTASYIWFFLTYTLLNSTFYTANNIAYSSLTSLVTKNSTERVQMGSVRYIFAFSANLAIQSLTLRLVSAMGGGAAGWRSAAFLFAVVGLAANTISVFSVRELPESELTGDLSGGGEKYKLSEAVKLLFHNKYYLLIFGAQILQQVYSAMLNAGVYFMTYVLRDENLFGVFSWFVNIPLMLTLLVTPALTRRFGGMYRLNKWSYFLATLARAGVAVAGYLGSVPLMLVFSAAAAACQAPWQGDMNAVISNCSEYTFRTSGKRLDGIMFSCVSLGIKLGGGIGTALAGWLLEWSGYVGTAEVQPESCIQMLHVMYLILPVILDALIAWLLSRMKIEDALKSLPQA